jgi:MFS transporter, DHA1 family, staphyloferrin A biosynthesis exporter
MRAESTRVSPAAVAPAAVPSAAPAAATLDTEQRLGTFASLRYREYRLLWFGTLFSSSGQWIQQVSIGWLTYALTGSPFLLGLINGLRSVPLLVLGPFGGVAADRVDRKRLMLTTQLFLMTITAVFATVVGTGNAHVWNIALFTLLTGVGWAFNMPVRQSIVPQLVPRNALMNAMALNSAGFNVTRIVGPSLAGLLIAAVGIAGNFTLQAFAYLGVAAMVWMMQIPPRTNTVARDVSVGRNLAEGARFVWRHPTLRVQMLLALVPVVIAMPYTALMPMFAKDVLNLGPGGFGVLMAAPGVGAVIGTLTIASLGNVQRKGLLLFGALLALGVTLILFAQSRSVPVSIALLVLVGGFQMTYMTTNQTLLQLSTPDEFRGRVMGIYMLNQGLLPLGSLIAGVLADLWGAPLAVSVMGGTVLLLAGLAFVRLPSMRAL